jgi:hypothetical protein
MSETGQPVTILSASEGWNLLASAALGRLVTSVEAKQARLCRGLRRCSRCPEPNGNGGRLRHGEGFSGR